ncbi:hypothetical protein KP509_13G088700 [Ceratopteris richardii]|nr:hypothetical protein KP509_13G088700 [Ceratopteris richardii]
MGKVSMRIMEVLMGELLAREEEGVTARTAAGETVEIGGIGQKRRRKGDEEKVEAKVDGRGGGARTEVLVGEQRRNSVVRFNYYPPCPQPSLTLGLGAHSDPHLLTLLHQDLVGGLQICKDGLWMAVRPMPGALVVNIGDALQVWSNDHYKSVEHRAVCNSLRSRLSMGFFLTPMDDATICPLKLSSPHYKPFTWKEYREQMYARRPRGKSNLLHYRIHDQTQ